MVDAPAVVVTPAFAAGAEMFPILPGSALAPGGAVIVGNKA